MKRLHHLAGCALFILMTASTVRAQQVLEQVPSDAVGLFEVKNIQALSDKIAKFAKGLGLDQMDPRWGDPIASLQDQHGLKRGLNRNGDMAIAFFMPDKAKKAGAANAKPAEGQEKAEGESDQPPPFVVFIPTDDYKAFLTNFENVQEENNGVSKAQVPANKETLYLVHRGGYAEAAMDKSLLDKQPGFKLRGLARKEADTKDALLYVDIKTLRPMLRQGIKEGTDKFQQALQGNPMAPQMPKGFLSIAGKAIDQFVNDASSVGFSFNLTDAGIGTATLAEFEPESYLGKLARQVKNTDQPLLAGLPQRTYFMFGGMINTPAVMQQLVTDVLDILQKEAGNQGQDMAKVAEAIKQAVSKSESGSFGLVAPAQGEPFIQTVAVSRGDAKAILQANKQSLPVTSKLMNSMDPKTKVDVKFNEPATIDGVQLEQYSIKLNVDPNSPNAMQVQQAMTMMYGRNGIQGYMGAVSDNVFIQVQSSSQKLVSEVVDSAKNESDPLDKAAGVKQVTSQLPRQRAVEYYVALDNFLTAMARVAKQMGVPVQFKLPPDLPPIGIAAGTEQSTIRVDGFIPNQLVQSVTAAVMQTFMQMNGGGGQGGGV